MSWRQSISTLLKTGSFVSMLGGLVGSAFYLAYTDYSRYHRMMATFSRGNILPPMAENAFETVYFPRLALEQSLRRVLQPTFTNEYYLINGDIGTGKTRTIVELTRSLIASDGTRSEGAPIYVLANQGTNFAETLAKAVNFRFDEHISFRFFVNVLMRIHSMPLRDEIQRLTRVLDAIEESAFIYMQSTGRPVVIVIDGVNTLARARSGSVVVERLQEKAKLWADANIVKLVLVNNDESMEDQLRQNQSSWARIETPITVDDLADDEAIAFLTSPHHMEQDELKSDSPHEVMSLERARKIVQLVGGRILYLIAFRRDWQRGVRYDETAEELKGRERDKLQKVWRTSATWRILESVHAAPNQSIRVSDLLCSCSVDKVTDLVNKNIIRCDRDPDRGLVVTFRSVLTKHVVAEMQSMYSRVADCDGHQHQGHHESHGEAERPNKYVGDL